jgi:hypothetical protein
MDVQQMLLCLDTMVSLTGCLPAHVRAHSAGRLGSAAAAVHS